MVNSALRRRLEGWFLRQVFTIRQRMAVFYGFHCLVNRIARARLPCMPANSCVKY